MKSKYKYPKTKALINKLKKYIPEYEEIEQNYRDELRILEEQMEAETKVKGIEFIISESGVSIGNAEKNMELIHLEEIEKGKLEDID